jgi:filamentous hemagglutinin family protein
MNSKYLISSLTTIGIVSFSPITRAQTYQPTNRIPVADNSRIGTQVLETTSNNFTIKGGVNLGQNLLHSFTDFSVPTGGAATFDNSLGKQSIITRVTGGNFSDINGLVNTQGANFFLLNPNGIVFGTNAQLNVGQTFVGNTANGIDLVNGGGTTVNFGTNRSGDAQLLTINPNALFNVSRLNMGGGNGQISNFGTLQTVNPNQYIGLIGGTVTMNGGQINAPGGRVELGGFSAPGTVTLGVDSNNLRAQFPNNVARGDVSLTNQARVNVAGAGGGDIATIARNIEILGGSRFRSGIETELGTPQAVAGDIKLNATGELVVVGSNSFIGNNVNLNSKGNGGNIIIDAGSLSLRDGATIRASTYGQGNAGNVKVIAKKTVSLAGNSYVLSTVESGAVGKGGNIDIKADSLLLKDAGQLGTFTRGASDTQQPGKGDAGNITMTVTGAVDISGTKNGFDSAILSYIDPRTVGNGGNIAIDAGSFSLRDGARISASTYGIGNAGNVKVTAKDAISLVDGDIFSTVESGGVGKVGTININAGSLLLQDGAQITTSTFGTSDTQPAKGEGSAGNITVKVTGAVNIAGKKATFPSGIRSTVESGAVGKGGIIDINAASLSLQDGAQIAASTYGQGNAGNVKVIAKKTVSLAGNSYVLSTVESGAVGKGGNIDIKADSLLLKDAGQLGTFTRGASDTQQPGKGDAGNITMTVTGAVDISGTKNGFDSAILSYIDPRTVGNGGNIVIAAGSFSLRDGARISASTYGIGNAGNVKVTAKDAVFLGGNASLLSTVESGAVGKGGNIDIRANSLLLKDAGQLGTFTRGASATQQPGKGDAGNITVTVTGAVDISGKDKFTSAIFTDVETGTVGNGGNIAINADSFSLRDGAKLVALTSGLGNAGNVKVNADDFVTIAGKSSLIVNSQSQTGTAGDIMITSPKITLDRGLIDATSASGNGGNIQIGGQIPSQFVSIQSNPISPGETKLLSLRRGTQISTNASGTAQQGSNGGNITITAPNGFIVTAPNENSDISANGFSGSGGKVNIDTKQNFWISPLSRLELEKRLGTTEPNRLNPARLNTNDITAISQVNPNLSGQVSITPPQIDITAGLSPLPNNVTDPTNQINPNCSAKAIANNSFTSVGRGGIPATPKDPLNEQEIATNWVKLNPQDTLLSAPIATTPASSQPLGSAQGKPIVEAQGWRRERNGDIVLVAGSSLRTLPRQGQSPSGCVGQ